MLCGVALWADTPIVSAQATPAPPPTTTPEPAPVEPAPAEPRDAEPAADGEPAAEPPPDLAQEPDAVGEAPPGSEEAAGEAPPAQSEPAFDENLDVIVVTVERREQNLQDYAGSATAFSEKDLERGNVTSVRTLNTATPYVQIGTQEGNTEIFIRGVGSDYNTELGDPAVATHIDGVYIPRPRGVGSMFFDLERVEINRGPQGTLRGRNATAGSLNIVTAKPRLGEWDASGSVQLGNYWQRLSRAMVNIPIGEKVALRFATFTENRDPFYKNVGPIHTLQAAESADTFGWRAGVKWQPAKKLTVTVQNDYTHEGGTGFIGSTYTPAFDAGYSAKDVKNPRDNIYRGGQASQLLRHWGVNGDITLDLGSVLIGYLGSYRDLNYQQNQGSTAGVNFPGRLAMLGPTDLDNWSSTYWHSTSKAIIQELRIYAPPTQRVRWTAGGFFFKEEQSVFLGTTADQSAGFAGVEFNMPKVSGRSFAGFLDLTADIIDRLRGTAGVRVTNESKSRRGIGNIYSFTGAAEDTVFRNGTEGFRYRGLDRKDTTRVGGNADYTRGIAATGVRDTLPGLLDSGGLQLGNNINPQTGDYEATFVDYRFGLDFDVTDDNLLYVSFGTGHKSGGFNDTFFDKNGQPIAQGYDPEVLYSTEVGTKNAFLDKRLIANLSGFWYHYRDQQFQIVQQVEQTGTEGSVAATAVRLNAANSRILGLEADITARLPYGFQGTIAGLLLDARFMEGKIVDSRFSAGDDGPPEVDLEGNRLPRAPVASMNYSLAQAIDTAVGLFDWMVSAQTKSKQYMTVYNGNQAFADANNDQALNDQVGRYTRLDANIGYARPDRRLRIDIFGSNLTDVTYMTTLNTSPDLQRRFFNTPRQFGARLTVSL